MAATKTVVYISDSDAIHEIIKFLTDHADADDLAMIVSEYVRNGNVVVIDKNGYESVISCDGYVEEDDEDDDIAGELALDDDAMFFNQELEEK